MTHFLINEEPHPFQCRSKFIVAGTSLFTSQCYQDYTPMKWYFKKSNFFFCSAENFHNLKKITNGYTKISSKAMKKKYFMKIIIDKEVFRDIKIKRSIFQWNFLCLSEIDMLFSYSTLCEHKINRNQLFFQQTSTVIIRSWIKKTILDYKTNVELGIISIVSLGSWGFEYISSIFLFSLYNHVYHILIGISNY